MKASHDERIANIVFAKVYPAYLAKVRKKDRSEEELQQVICWLLGCSQEKLTNLLQTDKNLSEIFHQAKLPKEAKKITGVICGYRIEDIKNPLTKKIRYLDKIVDELAKGRSLEKIFRKRE